ncbi:hypothetical protein PYW07_012585 [Mythimna separata]|uniref:Uncharacterized protein n=1 Tax=Mythimna separata TaxID=271217 RepID=A0AAD8DLF9_MYTSE|nr:hypothetical protein PYW07_012585 [Mythimna separata]
MDISKSTLVKSYSTSEAKKYTQKKEKVSKSNDEFAPRTTLCTGVQPLKRGVYVEKKSTKISINNNAQSPDEPTNQLLITPNPMPRPSKKRFLTSVLNVLSKSTAGTQFPENTQGKKPDKTMNKQKIREDEEDLREEWATAPQIQKKKHKYRSRILNSQANIQDSFTVLQSKKDMLQSSSNHSEYINAYDADPVENETVDWPEGLPPRNQEYENTACNSNAKYCKQSKFPKSVDRGVYDFFVDMIKTTKEYDDMDTELKDELLSSANRSRASLHSNNSIRRNVSEANLKESASQTYFVPRKLSSHLAYSILPDEQKEWMNKQMLEHIQPQLSQHRRTAKRKRKLRQKHVEEKLCALQYKTGKLPKSSSLPLPRKKKSTKYNAKIIARQNAKENFLKSLKEELQLKSNETYEEPGNFFEALQVIARNKRLSEWKSDGSSDPDDTACQFKPRSVLSKRSAYYSEPRFSRGYRKRKNIKAHFDDETDYSHHSIEVVGYDYEKVRMPAKKEKKSCSSFVSAVSTPPNNEDFWADYKENDNSPLFIQRQYVLEKLRQLEGR